MMAELIARHISKIINMRNYIPASAVAKKLANWEHLNANVFRKIRFQLTPAIMQKIVEARPGMIERVWLHKFTRPKYLTPGLQQTLCILFLFFSGFEAVVPHTSARLEGGCYNIQKDGKCQI